MDVHKNGDGSIVREMAADIREGRNKLYSSILIPLGYVLLAVGALGLIYLLSRLIGALF